MLSPVRPAHPVQDRALGTESPLPPRPPVRVVRGPDAGVTWSYTEGFRLFGHPEVVVVGLAPSVAASLVRPLLRAHVTGRTAPVGRRLQLGGVTAMLVALPAGRSRHPAGDPVVQLLWADEEGRLPGDPGCAPEVATHQPLLASDPRAALVARPGRWCRRAA